MELKCKKCGGTDFEVSVYCMTTVALKVKPTPAGEDAVVEGSMVETDESEKNVWLTCAGCGESTFNKSILIDGEEINPRNYDFKLKQAKFVVTPKGPGSLSVRKLSEQEIKEKEEKGERSRFEGEQEDFLEKLLTKYYIEEIISLEHGYCPEGKRLEKMKEITEDIAFRRERKEELLENAAELESARNYCDSKTYSWRSKFYLYFLLTDEEKRAMHEEVLKFVRETWPEHKDRELSLPMSVSDFFFWLEV